MKNSYDHHAAIYFLLLDKLKEQRTGLGKMSGGDGKRRRPSTIAEQPSKVMPGLEDFHSLRLRTTSETEREAGRGEAVGGGVPVCEMGETEHKCLTCGSPILDNTTSTTSCVKCARLRTRRMNFAHPPPHVSRDSGVSGGSGGSGGSQDAGDISPAQPSAPTCPVRPGKRDSVQFSTLVRKLSEVEGINPSHILR